MADDLREDTDPEINVDNIGDITDPGDLGPFLEEEHGDGFVFRSISLVREDLAVTEDLPEGSVEPLDEEITLETGEAEPEDAVNDAAHAIVGSVATVLQVRPKVRLRVRTEKLPVSAVRRTA